VVEHIASVELCCEVVVKDAIAGPDEVAAVGFPVLVRPLAHVDARHIGQLDKESEGGGLAHLTRVQGVGDAAGVLRSLDWCSRRLLNSLKLQPDNKVRVGRIAAGVVHVFPVGFGVSLARLRLWRVGVAGLLDFLLLQDGVHIRPEVEARWFRVPAALDRDTGAVIGLIFASKNLCEFGPLGDLRVFVVLFGFVPETWPDLVEALLWEI
jgi:hypothetical protein